MEWGCGGGLPVAVLPVGSLWHTRTPVPCPGCSLTIDTPLDRAIKESLLTDVMALVRALAGCWQAFAGWGICLLQASLRGMQRKLCSWPLL